MAIDSRGFARALALLVSAPVAAFCLAPSASADLMNGDAGGITYYSDFQTSTEFFSLTADCEGGPGRILGGGFIGPFFTRSQPFDDEDSNRQPDDGWTFRFDGGGGGGASATVIGMCSRDRPAYTAVAKVVAASETKVVKARCPGGMRVIGGGGAISGAIEDVNRVNSTFPYDAGDADAIRDDGWAIRIENNAAQAGKVKAHAVCLDTPATYVEVATTLPANGAVYPSPACPVDLHLASVGVESEGDAGQGFLFELRPLDSPSDPDNGYDDVGETAITNNPPGPTAPVTAVAVCIPDR